jgi:glycerol-3-phosphate cytidylyltransferase
LLTRARALGDHLTVGLSSDAFNQIKGKDVVHPYALRHQMLSSIRPVDAIICEDNWDQKIADITKHHIDIFVMGDDWQGKFDHLASHCQVLYLSRTHGISSSQIKSLRS